MTKPKTLADIKDIELHTTYIGTVQLLIETHNRLVKALRFDGGIDDDQVEVMENVASDFNGIANGLTMVKQGQSFAIFDKEDP